MATELLDSLAYNCTNNQINAINIIAYTVDIIELWKCFNSMTLCYVLWCMLCCVFSKKNNLEIVYLMANMK